MSRNVQNVIIVPFKPGNDHCLSVAYCIYKTLPPPRHFHLRRPRLQRRVDRALETPPAACANPAVSGSRWHNAGSAAAVPDSSDSIGPAPVNAQADIQLNIGVLPKCALFSVARILTAYLISLVFAIAYGRFAAHNARAERILIPLLDTLQSIPVLSFLPPVMVAIGHFV